MKAIIAITVQQGTFKLVRQKIQMFSFGPHTKIISCYDVTGICDVIVEVDFDGCLADLFEEVITTLYKEENINKVTTFPAYYSSPNKQGTDPLTGFLFIQVIPSQIKFVEKELYKLDEIASTSVVAGGYDIIARTTCPLQKMSDFHETKIVIGGIKRTTTCTPLDLYRNIASN